MKHILQIAIITLTIFGSSLLSQTINVPDDYTTIQEAIENAVDDNIILVQPGAYNENIDFLGKKIVVGSLFLTTGDTSYISQTIINGTGDTSVVSMQSGEELGTELVGFSITNGLGTGDWPFVRGGGVHLGIVYPDRSEPTIRYCYIYGNSCIGTSSRGGGIYSGVHKSHIENCKIYNNSANSGGGITLGNSTNGTKIDSCEIFNNEGGEGILVGYSEAVTVSHTLVHSNTGSGMRFHKTGPVIINNCTIVENAYSGLKFVSDEDTMLVSNSIIYNNTEVNIEHVGDSLLVIEYSIVQSDTSFWFNETCLVEDPMLDNGTYIPMANSPAIDGGNPNSPYDTDGTIADIGAFFFDQNAVGVEVFTNSQTDFTLKQNYPNPFNPSTIINYSLPKESNVILKIYNTIGQVVSTLVSQKQNAGSYGVEFNASNLPSGIYLYSIRITSTNSATDYVSVKKMILLR